MIPVLNMAGCIYLGDVTGQKDVESLCGECVRPLGECDWMLYSRPYAGSRYYTRVTSQYIAYVMAGCPLYVKPAEEVKEGEG